MSGWNPAKLVFELTPTKARFFLRRSVAGCPDGVDPVTWLLRAAGLHVEETRHGWNVRATAAQLWCVLSGLPDAGRDYHHEGARELRAAGLYVPVVAQNGQEV